MSALHRAWSKLGAGIVAHVRRHGEWWWAPVFYGLVVAWIYRDLWWSHGTAMGLGWDTIDTHGPDLDFFARDLREGRFSLWNPYDKGGYPVFADPVFDRYYPFNWPFALWGAARGTSWWLVQLKVLGHHAAAGVMMHGFLRSRGLSRRAAMVGGVGLIASSPLLVHKASNILWPLVWVPLVWFALDAALARPSWRRGVGVAAAFALCVTAGSPPGMFYAVLLIVPYALWRLGGTLLVPARRAWPELRRLLIAAGAALATIAPVLALTVVPTRQLVELAARHDQQGPGFALALSLPLGPAVRGVVARGAGLFEMYLGAAVVLLAACAIVLRPRFDRGVALLLLLVGALGVVLACGSTGKLLPWLVDHVPGFGLLRVPGRYKQLAAWSAAAAAGYGVAALEEARTKVSWRALVVAAGGVGLVVWLIVGYGQPASPQSRPAWWSIAAMAIAAALVVLAALPGRRTLALATSGLVLAVLIDAPLFLFLPTQGPAAEPRQRHDHDAAIVARLDGASDRWRIYDEFILGERAGARLRLRDFRGYPAVDPLSQQRYVEVLEFARHDPAILTDFNVRWVLARPHWRYGLSSTYAHLPEPHFDDRGDGLFEARHPAPLVAWYGAATVVAAKDALATLRASELPDGQRRRAVLEPADAARVPAALLATGEPPPSVVGELWSYEPDRIAVAIDAPAPGLVVLDELTFPGWQVEVDGVAAEALRANYLMRAVVVGSGRHAVVWTFAPTHGRLLLDGYLAALLVMLIAAAWPRRVTAGVTAGGAGAAATAPAPPAA
jgi:hypothetical protein